MVEREGPRLFGRNWSKKIRLNWQAIRLNRASDVSSELRTLLEKYQPLFSKTLGTIKNFSTKLTLKNEAKPKFCKSRPVPYALMASLSDELD